MSRGAAGQAAALSPIDKPEVPRYPAHLCDNAPTPQTAFGTVQSSGHAKRMTRRFAVCLQSPFESDV